MTPDTINYDFTDPVTLSRLIGILIPILVAVVTKKVSSSGLKAVVNLVLSAIGGSVVYLATADGDLDFPGYINAVLNTFTVSILAYYGILKPTGVTDTVTQKTANFGVGTPPAPQLETDDKGAEDQGEAVAAVLAETDGPLPQLAATPTPAAKVAAARKTAAKKTAAKKSTPPKA